MGVFFASTGSLIDPRSIPGVFFLSLDAIAIAAVAKLIPGVLLLRRTANLSSDNALPLAAALIPRAEIALIIAQYGITIGITRDLLATAMTVMIGTALLPAPILEFAKRRSSAAASAD